MASAALQLLQCVLRGDKSSVIKLLGEGVSVNSANAHGYTCLHHAVLAIKPDLEMVKLLLGQKDIDVDKQDSVGQTALIIACNNYPDGSPQQAHHPNLNLISALLDSDSNVHIKDRLSRTALSYALTHWDGNSSIIDLLVIHGADINDYNGTSPLQEAIHREDEETIHMLLCYNADPRPFFVMQPAPDYVTIAARELMYPFVSICDLEVLKNTDLSTLNDMWCYQDKKEFAKWCLEQDSVGLAIAIFSSAYKSCLGIEVFSRMLYTLFNEPLLDEMMYYPKTSETILHMLPQFGRYHLDDSDMADVLRILLCNSAFIHHSVIEYFQDAFRNPAEIVRVLEDFNIKVEMSQEVQQPRKSSLLWRMYLSNTFKVRDLTMFEVVDEIVTLSKFYNFNLRVGNKDEEESFLFPHCDCTLVELSRNKVRQMCKLSKVDREKPFAYADRIKALQIPKRLIEIVLLRTPLYPPTSLYIHRPPNYTSRW